MSKQLEFGFVRLPFFRRCLNFVAGLIRNFHRAKLQKDLPGFVTGYSGLWLGN